VAQVEAGQTRHEIELTGPGVAHGNRVEPRTVPLPASSASTAAVSCVVSSARLVPYQVSYTSANRSPKVSAPYAQSRIVLIVAAKPGHGVRQVIFIAPFGGQVHIVVGAI